LLSAETRATTGDEMPPMPWTTISLIGGEVTIAI
jgi:hypothetical protein